VTSPWLLLAGASLTAGALFGWLGVAGAMVGTAVISAASQDRWLLLVIVAGIAAALGVGRAAMHEVERIDASVVASDRATGVVVGQPQTGPAGERAVVQVDQVREGDGPWIGTDALVLVFFRDSAPGGITAGDEVELAWTVTDEPGLEPGFRQFVRSSGASATATAFSTTVVERGDDKENWLVRLRQTVTRGIERAIDGDAGALLAGFVTGDDSGLSEETRTAFERTNTSHITAVSGSNVAVLLALWYVLAPTRRLQRSLPAMAAILLIVWAYVALVGAGPGAVRAGLFATLVLPAARLGRRPEPLTALMAASALMLLVRPAFADSAGFWLSMAASTALVTVVSVERRDTASTVWKAMVGLLAAQIATFPITVLVFDQWSPASLIANLVIGPLVSLLFPFAFATAVAVTALPWIGDLLGWLPALGATMIISIVQALSREFPLVQLGAMSGLGTALLASVALGMVAILSADARRWLLRVAWRRPESARVMIPILAGAGAGIWLATLAFAALQ
jgi:competence protein ComEC